MVKKRGRSLLAILLVLSLIIILVLFAIIISNYSSKKTCEINNTSKLEYPYKVTDIIDGDTLVIERGNYVRPIGINAPEKNQPYYNESKEFMINLLLNKSVRIEKDIDNSDNYGRLLRYVFIEQDGKDVLVNTEIVKQGLAVPMTIEPNIMYKSEIDNARKECLSSKINLCK
jgi:micrococcal nuclease